MRAAKSRFGRSIHRPLILESLEARICLTGDLPVAAELPDDRCAFGQPRETDVGRAVHSINCFAADLFEHFQNEEGNLFLSPASIATALSMAYLGAAGDTAEEIRDVLHISDAPGIHESYAALLASYDSASDFELEFANAIWPSISVPIREEFTQTIKSDYRGTAQNLDYTDSAAREIINGWVEEKTHGKVVDLIDEPLDPNTVMVLTNALYFNAQWEFPFDPAYTDGWETPRFTLADGQVSDVPMMLTQAPAARTTVGDFDVLEMPFKGSDTSMVFMVPHEGKVNHVTPSLLADVDRWLTTSPEPGGFNISIPRFTTTVSSEFQKLLPGMGMPSAFTPGAADFSEMFEEPGPWIRKVRHKATLEINEQGTEAAAATSVEFVVCFAAGTPIMTPDGEKPIEQLTIGDLVLSRNEGDVEGPIQPKKIVETFQSRQETIQIGVGGQRIQTTKTHPFYVRERGWVAAGELRPGDALATDENGWQLVDTVEENGEVVPVYNFHVADLHTYFVGRQDWGFAVWVHNVCDIQDCVFHADRPFHFFIRDNVSSSILFLGRIEDPLQPESKLVPTMDDSDPKTGDLNGDARINGADADLLVAAIVEGSNDLRFDLNEDAAVDAQDVIQWRSLAGAANLPAGVSYPVGDADLDGKVGTADLSRLGGNWRQRSVGWSGGDFNADGIVDAIDLNRLGRNWRTDVFEQAVSSEGALGNEGALGDDRPARAPLAITLDSRVDLGSFSSGQTGDGLIDKTAPATDRTDAADSSAADEFFAAFESRSRSVESEVGGHSRSHSHSIRRLVTRRHRRVDHSIGAVDSMRPALKPEVSPASAIER